MPITAIKSLRSAVLLVAVAVMLLYGCSGGGDSATVSTGRLHISITDKMSDSFDQVVISIREIRIVPAGRENAGDNDPGLPVIARFSSPRVIDVMKLQFVQETLGDVILPAGSYSQVRLILEPNPNGMGQPMMNYLVLKSDPNSKVPLATPSAQQSGLKILGPIQINSGVINAVMIDFDPNTAIVSRGNGGYNLKPTGIRLVQMADVLAQYGSITGNVTMYSSWSSATVSVKRRGPVNDVDSIAAGRIFSTYTSGSWQAPFAAFIPGSATLSYKTFISVNGFQIYSSPAVRVTAGVAADLGNIGLNRNP